MAIFYPELNEIWNSKIEPPHPGEDVLLRLLEKQLENDDTYEVYFQTHINMAHPDIVLIRRGGGVLIIEVKSWNLDRYAFRDTGDEFGCLTENHGGHRIANPFQQVQSYKNEFYNRFCSALNIQKLKSNRAYGIIRTVVYFHGSSEEQVEKLFGCGRFTDNAFQYNYWADDSDIAGGIRKLIPKYRPDFTEKIYQQIRSVLTPSREWLEQSEPVMLSKKQREFAESRPGTRQKIKGVAGSGKTLVLAQRAVNCHKRTGQRVLILTYNITLKSYIRDKISQMSRDENWLGRYKANYFWRDNIHSFLSQMCQINDVPQEEYLPQDEYASAEEYEASFGLFTDRAIAALREREDEIKLKFHGILIDEVQDFEYEWLLAIRDLFLEEGGELVLFGDEKQNIYNRSLDKKKLPRTPLPGDWKRLKKCYRLTQKNGELAYAFQKQFFGDKYEQSIPEYAQMTLEGFAGREDLRYYEIPDSSDPAEALCDIIEGFRTDGTPISPNDICVLSEDCDILRDAACLLNTQGQEISTVCETKEEYETVMKKYPVDNQNEKDRKRNEARRKMALNTLRKIKKNEFEMNPGVMKFSTIHSFKGWEINTIILWIDGKKQSDELIYTAITRAKKNLVIVNCGNERYRDFFNDKNNIEKRYKCVSPIPTGPVFPVGPAVPAVPTLPLPTEPFSGPF